MADQIPLKVIRTLGDTTALGEFEVGETTGLAFGGTGGTTAGAARTNLGAAASALTLTAGDGLGGGGDLSANRTFSVNVQHSIEIDTDVLQLVNDVASPGNNQVYGTTGAGVKGWKADPAGGGDPDQNLWETITSDAGSAVANTTTDTLTIAGGEGISTAIAGDTLTITADSGFSGLGTWRYRTAITATPASGQLQFDNVTIESATNLYINVTNEGGTDMSAFLGSVTSGALLYIQIQADASQFVVIEVGTSSLLSGVYTFPITSIESEGTAPSNNTAVSLVISGSGGGSGSDELVKVSVNDTTAGFLGTKLVNGTGISLTENNDGGNETLTVANTAPNVDQNLWETISSDSGSIAANTTTDTLTIAGGIGTNTSIAGDTLTIDGAVFLSTINSQPVITFTDTTRSNKVLSTSEIAETWGRKKVDAGDWLKFGDQNSILGGATMPLDGTVVRATTMTSLVDGDNSGTDLYINGVLSTANIGVITGLNPAGPEEDVREDLDINFSQGDILNVRAIDGASSDLVDLRTTLFIRWRAA